VRNIEGNTEKLYSQISQEEEVYEKTRANDERRQKKIEAFITRFRAKARLANLVQSRIKTLDFSFRYKPFRGKVALRARNLCFCYDPHVSLIKDLSITIGAGDRVCVIGRNGKGKTTLLKLLAGRLTPQGGETACHPGLTKGCFEQTNVESLVDTRTVEEDRDPFSWRKKQGDAEETACNAFKPSLFGRTDKPS